MIFGRLAKVGLRGIPRMLGFEQVPPQLFEKVTQEIRARKGLKAEVPTEANYTD